MMTLKIKLKLKQKRSEEKNRQENLTTKFRYFLFSLPFIPSLTLTIVLKTISAFLK